MQIDSARLKQLRADMPWSQDELAIAAGVSLRTVQRAERSGAASLQTLKAIAAALEVDSSVLRGSVRNPNPSPIETGSVDAPELPATSRRSRVRVAASWAAAALGCVVLLHAVRGSSLDFRRPEDFPMAERILGHWESSSGGAILTLDLDGRMMNPGGEVIGNSSYTLVGDVISYWQGGQLFSARVTFPSPGEMVWSGLAFGRIGRFTRKRIVLPRREEVYASIQGHWQGQGDIRALEVVPERLKLTFADGRQAEENYLISGLRLSFNLEGEVQHFAIEVAGDELTLTKSYTGSRQSFTRPAASPPSQELGRQSPSVATGTAPAP